MPTITIPAITIRTTSDGPGHVHGLAVGAGLTLDAAMLSLTMEAQRQAEEIAAQYSGPDRADQPDAAWHFEVIDVRIVIGPEGSGNESWCCYGTLCSTGANPWAASFWEQQH